MARVTVSCPVYPSEDPDKVRAAVLNLFPTAELALADGVLSGPADLVRFSQKIREQRILDTARSQFLKGERRGHTVATIRLNKQVATVGKVSFVDYRTVLGTIDVTVEDEDLDALIDRVAPVTVNGEEVSC
ncbi:hypothetical protein AUQ37_01915 [Candidatus Methanomethylophilus sp. 1R26]|jgi:predicted RNA binding protein with dsRBD fold (UPF0201 family)|uniref:RNA-binding domain-containing protein n=1 Tax=Candidatus Methanomethylophilus sp. 1R26 TaxID=1769296 RepID=UPI000736AA9C|nr:RNA-binding domain-containing protein [Candidatus Methanomethylophilus sp. 1R26]MCH3978409.1 hypothetical protein [Methanomethylophilus sp.]WII08596.1 hypothetical protein O8W32_05330 [Methanomassiliicoccales archaeon LGM-DZ1]KUE73420.1 hypothetical protein AUQ37_01915 [Candidatus Methanomethylophilus sp. 1R26]MCI2074820.1 hypothetical protein [Methanomethylophilus sp.]MCI2092260.1 hypothetical protein [Methanomethylophilus sp.]